MPGGRYDSSKTRVVPVFDALRTRGDDWIRSLIRLPEGGGRQPDLDGLDLVFEEGFWGASERGLQPPHSLLDWLIENVKRPVRSATHHPLRERLFDRDPDVIREAQRLLRSRGKTRGWYVFEGLTYPDAFLVTPSALIVVEGKRTEAGPTADTTWLKGRHQMWRHIDAAWEIRGRRQVFGFFVVEAEMGGTRAPIVWQQAVRDTVDPAVLHASLPHRTTEERGHLATCFLGATTWQRLCEHFSLTEACLPETVGQRPGELT